jgi:hypothetical protein
MTKFELDIETYLLFPIFGLGAAATLGIIEATIIPWVNLGDVILELGSIEWTIGRLLSIVALLAVVINRDDPLDVDAWGVIEMWTFYVTIGLIIAPPFFPALESTLAEMPAAFLSFTTQTIGFALITYIN